jgi:DNA-binding LytR/AlgR family response regulator
MSPLHSIATTKSNLMSNIRILILEDQALQAAALADMLKKMGYEVVGIATSGERAIKMYKETMPDLVTLDIIVFGSMNGIDAGEAMMEIQRVPHIYISAYLDDFFPDWMKTKPVASFSKPYNERDLHRAIELAIEVYAREEALEPEPGSSPERVVFPNLILSRDCLWIKQHLEARERFFKLPAQDVVMVKSDNVYLEFHFAEKARPIVIVMKISQFAEAIHGREHYKHLLRVGQSYVINLQRVKHFTKTYDEITLHNGTEIHISNTYRGIVREALTQY